MAAILPLTALVHDGVMARCYLSLLRHRGFVFRNILRLVYTPQGGIPRLLPGPLRRWYAAQSQQAAAMHWVRRLPRDEPKAFALLRRAICDSFDLPEDFFARLAQGFDYRQCATELSLLEVRNFRDPRLAGAIADLPEGPILFTGGGILPAALLQDSRRPFLHVHPGRLPQVRGADGVLWSMALFGKPSASCFVMAPGLDTGPLIAVTDFPALRLSLPREGATDLKTLYRLLYAYYDPVLRAELLCRIVQGRTPQALRALADNAVPQDAGIGQTYNFMHPRLQAAVFRQLFAREG
jgi:hypothetical protein